MNSLTDKAMLATLSIGQWSARKFDKKASKEIAEAHNSDVTMGWYNKSLIGKEALEEIQKLCNELRTLFYELTLPWQDDGQRILSSAGYMRLAEVIRKKKEELEKAKDKFFSSYPQYIEEAKQRLNGLFNSAEYPSESEIRTKFYVQFHVRPLPVAADFRVKLNDEEVDQIKKQISADLEQSFSDAKRDIWNRMKSVVTRMSANLHHYKTEPNTRLFDTVVTNISDLVDIIPMLNVDDDNQIATVAREMRKLTMLTADQLKENDGKRKEIANAADSILAKMASFV